MTDYLTTPGFLGTSATLRSDLTLILTLFTAVLFNIGFIQARQKKFTAHRRLQTVAVILNTLVVILSMVTSYIIYILPGIPAKLGEGDYAITTLHSIIGTIAVVLGVFVMLRGNKLVPKKLRFKNYKLFMRWTYALYMLATVGGIFIYIIVFVYGI